MQAHSIHLVYYSLIIEECVDHHPRESSQTCAALLVYTQKMSKRKHGTCFVQL